MKLFKKKAPVIILGEGILSDKIIVSGIHDGKGAIAITKNKPGVLRTYGRIPDEEEVETGEALVQIVFNRPDGIRNLAKQLEELYNHVVRYEEEKKKLDEAIEECMKAYE